MKVYKINPIKNNEIDFEVDAYCNEFDGINEIGIDMMGINEFEAPSILYFTADFLDISDYPFTDVSFPIFSKKMFEILNSNGGLNYNKIPVTMLDDSFLENPFQENGTLKHKIKRNTDYIAIQFKNYEDVFDYKKSKYEPCIVFPEDVGVIENLILKEPSKGFKPIFKIKEAMEYIFVNKRTKGDLENNNIKGCSFEEVETS